MIISSRIKFIACCLLLGATLQGRSAFAQNSVDKDPKVASKKLKATSVYYDATRARLKGEDKKAQELLLQVVKLDPDAAGAYYDLSLLSLKQQDPDNARKYINKAIDIDETNKWYHERYAQILIEEGKYDKAAEKYLALADKEKRDRAYLEIAAKLYANSGDLDNALVVLERIVKKYQDDEDVLLQMQQVYLKKNDLDNAAKIADRLIALNPNEGRYYVQLAELYANNDQPDKAFELYKKAESLFPDDPGLQLSLAEYYRVNGDNAKYHEYLTKVISNNTVEAPAKLAVLGNYLQTAQDFQAIANNAINYAELIVQQHPDNPMALSAYGDMLAQDGKPVKAAEQYKRSLDIDPSRYQVWQNLLFNYSGTEYADSLIKYSKKAIRLFPNQSLLHYLAAVGYMNGKDYSKAANAAQRALDLQPEDNTQLVADMYSLLGDIYNSDKQYDLSDENFEKSLKLNPNNPTVLNNYSYYLSVRGDRLEDAEKMSKRSLDLSPDQATFMDTYGWILYKMGNYKDARKYVQQAIGASGAAADATLWEHLGDIEYKLNNVDKAVEHWQKAKQSTGAEDLDKLDKKIRDRQLYE